MRAPTPKTLVYTLESTAAYHYPVMLAWEASVCIVNPLNANKSRRKTDKLDAKMLALQGMMGMWPASVICRRDQEEARLAVQHRLRLVRERTRITNQANNMVLRFGHTFATWLLEEKRGSLSAPHILPVFEALADGKLPKVRGISPEKIPEAVRVPMKEMFERVNWLNRAVLRAGTAALRAVERAEFTCAGGELVREVQKSRRCVRRPDPARVALHRLMEGRLMTNLCIVELTAALHGALSDIEGLVDETCADRLQWLAISPRLRNAYRRRLISVRNRLGDVVRQLDDIDEEEGE